MQFFKLDEETGAIKAITNVPGWTSELIYSGGNRNGVTAYEASAIAFRSIEIRAQSIPEAPLKLYTKEGEEVESHPVLDVLGNDGYDWNLSQALRDTESDYCVFGRGYWEKIRSNGRLIELFRFNPSVTVPEITSEGITKFRFNPITGGKGREVGRQDVIYFKGAYNPKDDLQGIAPLRYALVAALGERNADIYLNSFFENSAVPATLIVSDSPMPNKSDLERQVELWNQIFKGVTNQHKTGFVFNGGKPVKLGTDAKDLALDVIRSELRRTISTALGVPELLITPSNSSDLTPVEMAYKIFYGQTVLPRWNYFAEVLNQQLLTEYPDLVLSGAYFAFDLSNVKALNEEESRTAERLALLVEKKIIKAEVAAVELGYKSDDVPEIEKLVEEIPVEEVEEVEEVEPVEDEMKKWQRKSIKALKEGKSANVKFETNVISGLEQTRIRKGLEAVKTEAEIRAIFQPSHIGEVDLLEAIKELTIAIKSHDENN